MADTTITGATAAAAALGPMEIPVNDAGGDKKLTVTQLDAYIVEPTASSTAAQTLGTSDTYLAGSGITVTAGRIQAGTYYRCVMDMTKTAASTATAVIYLRMGTLGTTGDAAICTFTFPTAQTAAVDDGRFEVLANFRSVGTGTSAVVEGVLFINRTKTTTGFLSTSGLAFMAPNRVTSSGFNSATVTKVGISINAGASSAWTSQLVQAALVNQL